MTYGSLAADQISTSVTGVSLGPGNATNFKNRIINGGMVIDQRNGGAQITPANTGQYLVDRWQYNGSQASKVTAQQNAGSVTPPVGFINYQGITSSSAYSVLSSDYFQLLHKIEGLNCADLGWGTANAKTVTLSFWIYSSLTGTFGGSLRNSAADRSYPFSYTISSANTWTQISVTIAGDTTGTWLTTNGTGIILAFSLGAGSTFSSTAGAWSAGNYVSATGATSVVGTSGATFYITGVQFEVGSIATGFEFRDYGRELMLCQRYYQKMNAGTYCAIVTGQAYSTTNAIYGYSPVVWCRTTPTLTYADISTWSASAISQAITALTIGGTSTNNVIRLSGTVASGLVAGDATGLHSNSTTGYIAFSAEL